MASSCRSHESPLRFLGSGSTMGWKDGAMQADLGGPTLRFKKNIKIKVNLQNNGSVLHICKLRICASAAGQSKHSILLEGTWKEVDRETCCLGKCIIVSLDSCAVYILALGKMWPSSVEVGQVLSVCGSG